MKGTRVAVYNSNVARNIPFFLHFMPLWRDEMARWWWRQRTTVDNSRVTIEFCTRHLCRPPSSHPAAHSWYMHVHKYECVCEPVIISLCNHAHRDNCPWFDCCPHGIITINPRNAILRSTRSLPTRVLAVVFVPGCAVRRMNESVCESL